MVLPYLKGLVIIKCGFFYLALWMYCVFSICGDYIFRYIQVLNNWYHSTFLGQIREGFFSLFAKFFSGRKRGRRTSGSYMKFYEMNLEKKNGYLNSSRKNTQFQKNISRNGVREVKL
jgi:hypothetical protein